MATEVLIPPLGQTVDTVTLVSWYKEAGEAVSQGEMLFVIETDKATLDVEAPASGILRRVTAGPGDEVKVLSPIALIAAPDEVLEGSAPAPSPEPPRQQHRRPAPPGQAAPGGQKEGASPEQSRRAAPSALLRVTPSAELRAGSRIFISPRARRLAEKHGIPLMTLQATGPEGAIVERDVRAYMQAQEVGLEGEAAPRISPVARRLAKVQAHEVEVMQEISLHSARAVIAERLLQSVTSTARVALTAEADATALVDLRHQLRQDDVDVAYNDLLLYTLGRALRDHPLLNASLVGDSIKVWKRIHLGLAVDTGRGLLVPVVRDVDRKGLRQLAAETHSLIERARAGQCTLEELSGGTFTLTNLGMFGIDVFTPIINLPECAILGVGRIKKQPAVIGDQVVARQMVWLSLTFDHRLVDGAPAARFLQRVVHLVERPHLLMT